MNMAVTLREYLKSISGGRILKTMSYNLGSERLLRRLDGG
jgi:hypothetical protein